MIIRIMGEGQYRVKSGLFDDLNKLDNKIVEYVEKGDEKKYKKNLAELIKIIHKEGKAVPAKDLVESDVIVPPADMTLKEARQVFKGEGIFKG
jgi:PspA-Associated protein